MKKLILGIMCLVLCSYAKIYAQPFNNKYVYNDASGAVYGIPRDLIAAGSGNTCMLGKLTINVPPYYPNFYLQKTNSAGSTISFLKEYFYSTTSTTVTFEAQKVIQNGSGEYLVAGYIGSQVDNIPTNPFVAKFTATGSFLWAYGYNSNTKLPPNNFVDSISRVNIVATNDSLGNPVYIIVSQSNEDRTSPFPSDAHLNIFKIDDNGNLIWNYKYLPTGRSSAPYAILKEAPSAIAKISENAYFIAGHRDEISASGTDSISMFCLNIDRNGNIINNYKKITFKNSSPELQDAVYNADSVYLVYRLNKQTLTSGPTSIMGLTNLDVNLNLLFTKYYTYHAASDVFGASIKATSDKHYVIGCYADEGFGSASNAILKVAADGSVVFFKKYNWLTRAINNIRKDIVSYGTSPLETYTLLGDYYNGVSSVRLLSTDQSGNTCGVLDSGIVATKYVPAQFIIPYTRTALTGRFVINLVQDTLYTNPTPCDSTNPGYKDAYVGANTNNAFLQSSFKVYPTLLPAYSSNTIFLELNSDKETILRTCIYSIEGKKLFEKNFALAIGSNKLSFKMPLNYPGNYILTTETLDATYNKVTRITIQ